MNQSPFPAKLKEGAPSAAMIGDFRVKRLKTDGDDIWSDNPDVFD